jgi:hypothetical protein
MRRPLLRFIIDNLLLIIGIEIDKDDISIYDEEVNRST